jgi:ribosomal protein S18 acetylase RimI-like enzyme
VRPGTLEDLDRVAELFDAYRQFYDKPPDLALARAFLRERLQHHESVIFVAEASGRVVGFCQLYPTYCSVAAARTLVLYDLFVTPAARRTGAGQALMQAAEAYAADSGFVRLDLQTARTNMPAQALYESRGWQRDEAFFVYSKRLPAPS